MKAVYENSPEYRVRYDIRARGVFDRQDNHLGLINAAAAYARGATGAGETVVIVDSGFRADHREFNEDGKFRLVASFGDPCTAEELRRNTCAGRTHGTSSAGTAAGRRDGGPGLNMHGVAFDANIHGVRLKLGGGGTPAPLNLLDLDGVDGAARANFYERLLFEPVDASLPVNERIYDRSKPWGFVFNMSFGLAFGIASYSRAQIRATFPQLAGILAQADRPAADRSIIVWSAGNQNGRRYASGRLINASAPTLFTGIGVHFPELQGHVLAVVSVQQNGIIAGSSNRCGIAKGFCIAAPGVEMIAPDARSTTEYREWSGTSAAAPVVTGALAVMRSFFKNPDGSYSLGNTELVTRMLATADRTGIYSDSDTYGHGLLDLDAATRPVGALMTASPGAAGATPIDGTSLDITRGAFGGQLSRALDGVPMAVFDQLGTPFFRDAGLLVRGGGQSDLAAFAAASAPASAPHNLLLRVDSGNFDWWLAPHYNSGRALGVLGGEAPLAFIDRDAFAAPYFSLVRHGFGGGFSATTQNRAGLGLAVMRGAAQVGGGALDDWKHGTAVAFGYRPANRAFSLQAGVVREGEGFLGARPGGAMGAARGETVFAGIDGAWNAGRWRALASGYVGQTRPNASPGLLRGVSNLHSSAFSLGLSRRSAVRKDDWLGFRLTQPMRVESGRAKLRLATSRSKYGVVSYSDIPVDLQPRVRELQGEAAWRVSAFGGELALGVQATRYPGHDAEAGVDWFGWVRFEKEF